MNINYLPTEVLLHVSHYVKTIGCYHLRAFGQVCHLWRDIALSHMHRACVSNAEAAENDHPDCVVGYITREDYVAMCRVGAVACLARYLDTCPTLYGTDMRHAAAEAGRIDVLDLINELHNSWPLSEHEEHAIAAKNGRLEFLKAKHERRRLQLSFRHGELARAAIEGCHLDVIKWLASVGYIGTRTRKRRRARILGQR
jgi:hypothetical protein